MNGCGYSQIQVSYHYLLVCVCVRWMENNKNKEKKRKETTKQEPIFLGAHPIQITLAQIPDSDLFKRPLNYTPFLLCSPGMVHTAHLSTRFSLMAFCKQLLGQHLDKEHERFGSMVAGHHVIIPPTMFFCKRAAARRRTGQSPPNKAETKSRWNCIRDSWFKKKLEPPLGCQLSGGKVDEQMILALLGSKNSAS